ncbi:hypothetical protein KR084_006628 [Drosophila pseudotakahashii]|nr:hypothetical protein KR084_006628 [Drosophila pseudotakahashii]
MLDITEMCRVCRDESDCLVDLFADSCPPRGTGDQEPQLATMLRECTGCRVKRADGMPQFICVECAEATRKAFRLRRQCRKSHQYFEQLRGMIKELEGIEVRLKMENPTGPAKPEPGVKVGATAEECQSQGLEPLFVKLVEQKYKSLVSEEQLTEMKSTVEKPAEKIIPKKRARSYSESESWSPESDCAKDEDEIWEGSKKSKTKKLRQAFQCLHCDHSFSQNIHLEIHMRIHTGERPFKCSYCPRSFAQKGNLQTHMRCHTGERPYECPICSSRFRQIGQLRVHSRVHTGERPFKCNICRFRFSQKNGLVKHMTVHTGVKFQPGKRRTKKKNA